LALVFLSGRVLQASTLGGLIPETVATSHGLTRNWFTQIQVDPARGRVQSMILHEGMLFVATDRAMLHALDAETGQTLWVEQVGSPDHPTLTPGASKRLVGVVNGSNLYVLNRSNGRLLWKTEVEGAPGAGPALSEQRIYVPTVSGLVLSYRLQPLEDPMKELGKTPDKSQKLSAQEKAAQEAQRHETLRLSNEVVVPLACKSWGRAMVQPIITRQNENEEYTAWPTDHGSLFVAGINRLEADRFTVRYSMGTATGIVSQPSYLPPDPKVIGDSGAIYVGSKDGFVYAIREKDGSSLWRFSTGEPLVQRAVAIDPFIFAATQPGGMYCLNAAKGGQVWWAPQVVQFVAASKNRVYATDKVGLLHVLDARNGSRLDTIASYGLPLKLTNTETDRIYLASETGLIQCLRESGLSQPVHHNLQRLKKPEKTATQQKTIDRAPGEKKPKAEGEGEAQANPFGEGAAEAGAEAKPAKKPAGEHPAKKPRKKKDAEAEEDAEGEEGGLAGAIGKDKEKDAAAEDGDGLGDHKAGAAGHAKAGRAKKAASKRKKKDQEEEQ
jgi:outer membrane protein assembly factor BamB